MSSHAILLENIKQRDSEAAAESAKKIFDLSEKIVKNFKKKTKVTETKRPEVKGPH